ncbi:hypothetical protein HYE67_008910 [Fusarium culmorum]|uniref:Uncharacterized protein n=1 Tax=Fusarium culmorum TaxID=5516 RepID=A0A7S8DDW4_FUSCU|nr:hypothetical protein HYE67_008910 [Fusarium culmorum]
MGLIGVRNPTGCPSVEKDEYGGSEGANVTTATWQMIMIRKNKAGLTIRLSSVQTQTQIQTQQITTPGDIGTKAKNTRRRTRGKGPMKEEAYQSAKSNLVTSVATYTVTATYNYSSSTVEQLR